LKKIANQIKEELKKLDDKFQTLKKKKQIRRLRLINYFLKEKNKPEWMVLNHLPVLPPDLRPMLITKGGVRYVKNELRFI
jgi:DNA-directed RNA polymerase subunit beta'